MDLFDLGAQRDEFLPSAYAWSFREARVLQVAVRLAVFDALDERAKSAERLAAELETDPEMTERLLVALSGLALLEHDNGLWRNTLAASMYLVRSKALFQGDVIEMAAELWDLYHHLEHLIRKGQGAHDLPYMNPQRLARFEGYARALHGFAIAGQAQRLARTVDVIAARRRLLDVGGAPGTYSVALCQRHPALRATVLIGEDDRALTEQVIQDYGPAERLTVVHGTLSSEQFGQEGYDALLFNHVLAGPEPDALLLLVQGYETLQAGGLLIVQTWLLDTDLNGNRSAALYNMLGNAFTLEKMHALVAEAGFERSALLFRAGEGGCDILIAYKPDRGPEEPQEALVEYISPEQELFAIMGLGEDTSDGLTIQRRMWERLVQTN